MVFHTKYMGFHKKSIVLHTKSMIFHTKSMISNATFLPFGRYPSMSGSYESTSRPGVFFAGTLAHARDWRKATGGVIHGFRYTAIALFHILENR